MKPYLTLDEVETIVHKYIPEEEKNHFLITPLFPDDYFVFAEEVGKLELDPDYKLKLYRNLEDINLEVLSFVISYKRPNNDLICAAFKTNLFDIPRLKITGVYDDHIEYLVISCLKIIRSKILELLAESN